jgi:hypothetical protein
MRLYERIDSLYPTCLLDRSQPFPFRCACLFSRALVRAVWDMNFAQARAKILKLKKGSSRNFVGRCELDKRSLSFVFTAAFLHVNI